MTIKPISRASSTDPVNEQTNMCYSWQIVNAVLPYRMIPVEDMSGSSSQPHVLRNKTQTQNIFTNTLAIQLRLFSDWNHNLTYVLFLTYDIIFNLYFATWLVTSVQVPMNPSPHIIPGRSPAYHLSQNVFSLPVVPPSISCLSYRLQTFN